MSETLSGEAVFVTSAITVRRSLNLIGPAVNRGKHRKRRFFADDQTKKKPSQSIARVSVASADGSHVFRPMGDKSQNCLGRTDRHAQVSAGGVMILLTLPCFGIDFRSRSVA
ncbi:hypothetical protein J2847_000642 [Azospirillum agricola]|uniref:hypothetical protein n=1 Tax=Azospirillum agricola TaxID=1720247 RepID=UPI001AE6DB3A|nr:hypothetical protein [Azospirillum agricola]MBP2227362.1 hypothetical protein [Azospirillum agricola]